MRYLLHQSEPNLSVLACICIFRHQITHHHNKAYSYFVEIAMSSLNLICCNKVGVETSLHLIRLFVRPNATKKLSTEQPISESPDEESSFNKLVIHTHISDYFLPDTVSVYMYPRNFLQWYALHHLLYIPQFLHVLDHYLHPSQRR